MKDSGLSAKCTHAEQVGSTGKLDKIWGLQAPDLATLARACHHVSLLAHAPQPPLFNRSALAAPFSQSSAYFYLCSSVWLRLSLSAKRLAGVETKQDKDPRLGLISFLSYNRNFDDYFFVTSGEIASALLATQTGMASLWMTRGWLARNVVVHALLIGS